MSTKSLSLFDLAPGKVLHDRYAIKRPHRQGGMSATFEVEDQVEGGTRELQVFPSALFEKREQTAEFAGSMRRWIGVRSPHVLAVTNVDVLDDGSILFVTEFPPGIALRSWLNEHVRVAPPRAVALGVQLLDGLSAIHAADLVHGDIKPYTIHVVGEGAEMQVVLLDGGVTPGLWSAKHLGEKTALIGTPLYAPVEQFGGESPDVRSDVYNVATVLYEMLTGMLPWTGKSFLEVFQAKLEKTPPSMRSRAPKVDVPLELEMAVAGGLMADRKKRFGSAEEFKKRLQALGEL